MVRNGLSYNFETVHSLTLAPICLLGFKKGVKD